MHRTRILADAESAREVVYLKTSRRSGEVTIVGHSLGRGNACQLAVEFQRKASVLQRTFNTNVDAEDAHYQFFRSAI